MNGHPSFRTRIFLLVAAVATVPLAIVGFWLARGASRSGEALLAERVERALDATVDELVAHWLERRSRVLGLAEDPALAEALRSPGPAPDGSPFGPEALRERFRELGTSVAAVTVYDRGREARWTVARTPDGEVAWTAGAGAGAWRASTVRWEVSVWEGLSDRRLGTVEVLLEHEALLPLTAVPAEAAGMVLGLFDLDGRRSLRPVPFDPELLRREEFRWGGDRWVTRRRTIRDPPLTLVAAAPASPVVGPFDGAARRGGLAILATALLGLVAAAALSRRLTRSLERLSDAAQAVAAGDFEGRVAGEGRDEVGRVAAAFNVMAESLEETLDELAAKESLAAVGEFAASLAHEVRNPLTAIRVDLQRALAGVGPGSELRAPLERALAEIEHLNATIEDTLAEARIGRPGADVVDLGEVLRSAADAARPFFAERRATLSLAPTEPGVRIRGDPETLRQAFLNVLRNAAEALGPGGRAEVIVEEDGDAAEVTFVDNGPGIPEELRDRIFEPLFTTRSEGTGLGLTIVKRIVEAHAGTVRVESEPGRGTRVRVRLPGA